MFWETGTVGSNPTLSAMKTLVIFVGLAFRFDSRVPRNRDVRTPPGPGGSNGSNDLCVPRDTRLSFFRHGSIGSTFKVSGLEDGGLQEPNLEPGTFNDALF